MMLQAILILALIQNIDINIIIVEEEKKKSIIGKRMIVRDNSYIALCDNKEVEGRLHNKVVEIVSEPYEEFVEGICGNYHKHTFVNVRSLDSGLFYRVLFCEDDIIENDKEQQDSVLGRKIKVNDNSYSLLLGTSVHPHVYGETLVIITDPYIDTDSEWGKDYIFVNAIGKRGNIYRVLFNEDALVEE
jgi:hypothetical protein